MSAEVQRALDALRVSGPFERVGDDADQSSERGRMMLTKVTRALTWWLTAFDPESVTVGQVRGC